MKKEIFNVNGDGNGSIRSRIFRLPMMRLRKTSEPELRRCIMESDETNENLSDSDCDSFDENDIRHWMRSDSDMPEGESVTNHSSATTFDNGDQFSSAVEDDVLANLVPRSIKDDTSFLAFRLSYLFVTLVVMLADGLQGTHLYVLYESYGYSVASLYSLGFFAGALTAPIIGPLIDRLGRKKAALVYCGLEIWINQLEQYPFLVGLLVSRIVGGMTTNLLSIVFEAWVDTEYRIRGFPEEKYELLMRDSVIVSNLAAIASGYLSHLLASNFGPVGPFEGAVTSTGIAFAVIFVLWNENYGKSGGDSQPTSSFTELIDTVNCIKSDSKVLRICIIQGLTLGSLHIFIFLWSPLLKDFALGATSAGKKQLWGMDSENAPAYGLIFGAYMAAGVLGGLCSPVFRKLVTVLLSPLTRKAPPKTVSIDGEDDVRPMTVELQGSLCYFCCSFLLLVPSTMSASNMHSFSFSLTLFILYEFTVGIYSPCEGVIRSLYIPSERRGSIMAVPTIIVNVAVAFAVISTEAVSKQTSMAFVSLLLFIAGVLQLSIISKSDWNCIFGRIEQVKRSSLRPIYVFCNSTKDFANDFLDSSEEDSSLDLTVSSLQNSSDDKQD